jgi:hypothetical protein
MVQAKRKSSIGFCFRFRHGLEVTCPVSAFYQALRQLAGWKS